MYLRRLLIAVGIVAATTLAWFLAVDWFWFEDFCPDCWHDRDVYQYRVCGYVIHEDSRIYQSELERACIDLDVPCSHPHLKRWHKHRLWGLKICGCPCINGTLRLLNEPDYYDRQLAPKIKSLQAERPDFGEILRQRVLVDHDFKFWHALVGGFEAEEHSEISESPIE